MSRPAPLHYNQVAGQSPERLRGISDGIFAVAMTLLVLGLAVPAGDSVHSEADLWNAIVNLGPSLLTYVMSFLTLGIFWVGQHAQIQRLERSDRHITWIMLGFLVFVTLIPFTTALLARFIDYRLAVLVYWFNIFALGSVLLASLAYGKHANLFATDDESLAAVAAMRRRIYIAQALYGVATALCIVSPYLSVALIVLVQLNYAIAPRVPVLSKL
jgi:uncharacterized membrane protein